MLYQACVICNMKKGLIHSTIKAINPKYAWEEAWVPILLCLNTTHIYKEEEAQVFEGEKKVKRKIIGTTQAKEGGKRSSYVCSQDLSL